MTNDAKKDGNGKAVTEIPKPTCFVVSPIGAAGSPERKHANVTLKFVIEPVLERYGFQKALRADTLGEPGIISRQIISQLLNADLVIADLTGHNPNVYYELAIRHGTGKPFVQLLTRGQTLPFDVLQQRTIFFDRTDLEDVEDCKAELERQITSVMASTTPMETPIGQTLDYEKLRSGGGVEQALAKLADQMAEMNRDSQGPRVNNLRRESMQQDRTIDGIDLHVVVAVRQAWEALGIKGRPPRSLFLEAESEMQARYANEAPLHPDLLFDLATSLIERRWGLVVKGADAIKEHEAKI